jgi:hypothetical protein
MRSQRRCATGIGNTGLSIEFLQATNASLQQRELQVAQLAPTLLLPEWFNALAANSLRLWRRPPQPLARGQRPAVAGIDGCGLSLFIADYSGGE